MDEPRGQDQAAEMVERARAMLRLSFGYSDFRMGQGEAIASVLRGRNVLAVMPTGSGKSLLYQLPAMMDGGLTVVVSPLIALMKDQVDDLRARGVAATFVNSSLGLTEQKERLAKCADGTMRLLYVAPERFRNQAFSGAIAKVRVSRLAVDEAHCISAWGHDFRPDYRRLKEFRARIGQPPVTALTATATPRVRTDILECLGLSAGEVDVHVHGFDRPNLALSVVDAYSAADKDRFLVELLRRQRGAGIVYVGTRKKADEVAESLRAVEPATVVYHAGLDEDARTRAQEAFLEGRARVAVATVAFGMGIDKADVRFVVHYHFPGSVEQYYQEIGRAGRDGQPSECVLLYAASDRLLREFFIDMNYPPRDVVQRVQEALWDIDANPVMLTYEQIAESCGEDVKSGHVAAAVRLLDEAGATRALTGRASAGVTIEAPGAAILPKIRGKSQRAIFEAIAAEADLEEPGRYEVDVVRLAQAAGMSPEQARRALGALAEAGHIEYEPPFRGRGVEKRLEAVADFDAIGIDWERQEFLRSLEYEKLTAMESYIREERCRRRHIVTYFGEASDLACGTYDRCLQAGAAGTGATGKPSRAGGQDRVRLLALLCVDKMRFAVGANRIAQVLTGSREKNLIAWGFDRNPCYGALRGGQEEARKAVNQLQQEGLLGREGDYDRPVLVLTEKGRKLIEGVSVKELLEKKGEWKGMEDAETRRRGDAERGRDGERGREGIERAALECVARIGGPVGVMKVAGVLTGSEAAWVKEMSADTLGVYGTVDAGKDEVAKVILGMVEEGLLRRDASSRYPVLELTEKGLARLEGEREGLTAENAESAEEEGETKREEREGTDAEPQAGEGGKRAGESAESHYELRTKNYELEDQATQNVHGEPWVTETPAGAEETLRGLVERLMGARREEVEGLLGELRMYHPAAVAGALAGRYAGADGERTQARAVWAAGELCGVEAGEFVMLAARSGSEAVRRQAAWAAGKMAGRLRGGELMARELVERMRETVKGMMEDESGVVRQEALKAMNAMGG